MLLLLELMPARRLFQRTLRARKMLRHAARAAFRAMPQALPHEALLLCRLCRYRRLRAAPRAAVALRVVLLPLRRRRRAAA